MYPNNTRVFSPVPKNAIISAPFSDALNAYYNGQPIPAGYTITPQSPDVNHPTALPLVAVVGAPYINATTIKTDGFDVSINANVHFANGWSFESVADATYIRKLNTYFPDGHVEKYAGTIGNYNLTAGTGTPHPHPSQVEHDSTKPAPEALRVI